jgi:hypothetical protein
MTTGNAEAPDDGVKHPTVGNWLQPDETGRGFAEINLATGEQRPASADHWAQRFLAVNLDVSVPAEVRQMWEVARGVALYGWFYYPLYAIAEHQLRRVADAATVHRCQQAGGPSNASFRRRVDWLIEERIIPVEKKSRWEAIRELRNETTHASIRHLVMPLDVLGVLDLLQAEINALFVV